MLSEVTQPPAPARAGGTRSARSRLIIAMLFAAAGVLHFVMPASYERIVPPWLPNAQLLVQVSGVAEMLGAIGVLLAPTRRAAGWGLIALLVAVFPANVYMLQLAVRDGASGWWQLALLLRLPLQLLLIRWVFLATRAPRSGR